MKYRNTIKKLHFNSRRLYKFKVFGFLSFVIILSCKNDIEKINSLKNYANLPVESAKDITIIRSDSGLIQMVMTSAQLDRYQSEQMYSKFPKGLYVEFYDQYKNIKSKLSANYAINFEDKRIMEVKNNVVIVDLAKGDTIYTQSLTWDQNTKTIFSNVAVKRVNKEGVLYGDGFDADENFNKYTLRRPRGTMNIDKDE